MEDSYLIQRLKKPFERGSSPYAFGGGMLRGGFNQEAYDYLNRICRFDYMGSAEFEFGAVPEAFGKMLNYNLNDFTIDVNLKDVTRNLYGKDKKAKLKTGETTIYGIGNIPDIPEIITRIKSMYQSEYVKNVKAQPLLAQALQPINDWESGLVGWIELDNGYMFFIDKYMFEGFRSSFSI